MKRVFSLLLVLTMLCGLITAFAAEEAPAEEPAAEESVVEVIPEEVPAEEPAEVPAEEPAEAPVEEAAPAEEPAEEEAPAEEVPADEAPAEEEAAEVVTDGALPDDAAPTEISLGRITDSVSTAGETKYYTFTPTVTAAYVLYTSNDYTGYHAAHIELYDGTTKELLASGDDENSCLAYEMTAGNTYIYSVSLLNDETCEFETTLAATGSCGAEGSSLTWRLFYFSVTKIYKVEITGTGAMADYSADAPAPWYLFINSLGLDTAPTMSASIDEGITSVGDYAFYNCSGLAYVGFPSTLTSIGKYAFASSGISSSTYDGKVIGTLIIPGNVETIGEYAFLDCTALRAVAFGSITLDGNTPSFTSSSKLTAFSEGLFKNCTALQYFDVPSTLESIGDSAFYNCSALAAVTYGNNFNIRYMLMFPDSVKTIGAQAFYGCSTLQYLRFNDGLTTIGKDAFAECASLSGAFIPKSVTVIGANAFDSYIDPRIPIQQKVKQNESIILPIYFVYGSYSCELDFVYYEGSADEWIAIDGIVAAPIIYYNVDADAESIDEDDILYSGYCGLCTNSNKNNSLLAWIYDPTSHTLTFKGTGGMEDFYGSSSVPWNSYADEIETVVIPKNVTTIGSYAFCRCTQLTGVTFPSGIYYIGSYAFADCTKLSDIQFSSLGSYLSIGYYAFENCGAETISLPASLSYISEGAFIDCENLKDIYIYSTDWNPSDDDGNFVDEGVTVHGYYNSSSSYYAIELGYDFECLDHPQGTEIESKSTEATCTEDGKITYTCVYCNHEYTEVIPATGHVWNTGTVTEPATCVKDGEMTYTCLNCSAARTEVIPAAGHKYDKVAVTDPTCTAQGYTTYSCTNEGCTSTYVTDIKPAAGHSYDDGVVTVEPTCGDTGIRTYTCSVCNGTYTEIIPATGRHSFDEGVLKQAATATHTGIKVYTCETCHHTYTTQIAKLAVIHAGTGWEYYHGSYYYFIDSKMVVSNWVYYENGWYYMDENGVMVTGVYDVPGDTTYSFASTGKMNADSWLWMNSAYYYFGSDGRMVKDNWVWYGGTYYYMGADGRMVTGEKTVGGLSYLFSDSGAMVTGWVQDGPSSWNYYGINNNDGLYGAMYKAHWAWYSGSYYYLDESGIMVTGEYAVGSTMYTFDSTGRWIG